jgi:hypothetical protein
MSSASQWSALYRTARIESLETRIVFSVDSVVADLVLQAELDQPGDVAVWSLADAHQSSGAEYVFRDYGFDGSGQTIAVIDSGIAWDHYALGGGFGESYRVVGGWDFAEGDADPFDDGPAGFHGTHVAGIIASDDPLHRGVAPGVDLVGLRVFDDQGNGNLHWVEQALRWVHEHRNDFANPITTVNLSLGVEWNAGHVPGWATLEDEFALLEADDIFVSVAAGNAFQNYQTPGLAYPAASNHVVPVASQGADGQLSDFSQRHERVLVAHGEMIRSTVPGHLFGNGPSHSFLSASGTSMAAPYVAGASAVLRQAMEFAGYHEINQDLLYEHFRQTATQFHDAVSGGLYHRLDLAAAIDAVIQDAHGNSATSATWLGTISGGEVLQGTIGRLDDVDAFSFTAGHSGHLKLQISQSHQLQATLSMNGQNLPLQDGVAEVDVVAGQTYTLALSSSGGIGHYDVDLEIARAIEPIDIGPVVSRQLVGQSVSGEVWYRLTASQDGILSASTAQDGLRIEILDESLQPLATANPHVPGTRADTWVSGGQSCLVRVTGTSANFDLRLNNQVALSNGILNVSGSSGDDHLVVEHDADGVVRVSVSHTTYGFSVEQVTRVQLDGRGGADQLTMHLPHEGDQIWLLPGSVNAVTRDFQVSARGVESIAVFGDATDHAVLLDSAGDDVFSSEGLSRRMTGEGYDNLSEGITRVQAVSRDGSDTARLSGSSGADEFNVTDRHVRQQLAGSGEIIASGFTQLHLAGGTGNDVLIVHGSAAADHFELLAQHSRITLGGVQVEARDFEKSVAVANGAEDSVTMRGTAGDDHVFSSESVTRVSGTGYQNVALHARQVTVDGSAGGRDTGQIVDTSGNDFVTGNHHQTRIEGSGLDRRFFDFESLTVVAENGGVDHAVFTGTRGRDTVFSESAATWVWGARYHTGLLGFSSVVVDGNGGVDVAVLHGDQTNNEFHVTRSQISLQRAAGQVTVSNFEHQRLDGRSGQNAVLMEGFSEADHLSASGSALLAYLNGQSIEAGNFSWLEAGTAEQQSSRHSIAAVDFWYALHGQWTIEE